MNIIHSHDITLLGGNADHSIALRPLTDAHLPYLYKWNSDPEVLYWADADDVKSYPPEAVHQIYGQPAEETLYFIIEADGELIGDCSLQRMNLPEIKAIYPADADVRRIDMMIGEKAWWGRGVGTLMVGMLVDFAFGVEKVDVLHCLCDDYNIRSRRVWEKCGFALVNAVRVPQSTKGEYEYHWRLTRAEYEAAHAPGERA